jgi:MSHA biogenesis protein MshN
MSLINDMLRNLEAKRPDDLARQSLQREIRSLPAGKRGKGRGLLLLILLGVLVAAGGAAQLGGYFDRSPQAVAPPPPPPPALTAPPELNQPPVPTPAEVPVPVDESLRLSSNLAVVPLPAAPMLGVPDPVVPPPVAAPAKSEAAPVQAVSGPVKIEKSPVAATPRDRADAEFRKAETALASGRSGEALDAMRAALKIDAGYVQVRQALLRQLLDMRRMDDAMAVLLEGVELMPAQTGWAMSLARLQLEHGDLAAADRTLARSQAYAEANADYAGFQGHLKSRLGAHRQAAVHYQRATRLVPNEGRWWLGLGLALEADGRVPEARDALRRALSSGSLSAELASVAEQHLRQ